MIAIAPKVHPNGQLDPIMKLKEMVGETAWNEVLADITEAIDELTTHIERIIERIPADHIPGAINWADLHCTDVQLIFGADTTRVCATVQEASPEAYKLAAHIVAELEKLGYNNVEVNTEW